MSLGAHGQEAAAKITVGPVIAFIGMMTANDFAMIMGGCCSLAIGVHTLWKFWTDVQDRRARKAAEASAGAAP